MKTLITICLLNKTIHFFLLLISLVLVFSTVSAEIKYKKIDTIISAPLLNQSHVYHHDMNNDGIAEYFFNHGNQMGDLVCEIYSEPTSFTNEILVENNIPAMLDYSSEISAISTVWINTYNGVGTNALYFLDNWPGAINKNVAIRFKINNAYHYGWIGIEIPSDSTYIKIKDCAYEDVAGQMIYAGYKGVEDVQDNIPLLKYNFIGNKIFINSPNDLIGNLYICVYDMRGDLIKFAIIHNSSAVLDFQYFNSGLYFIIVKNNNKILQRALIIK